jgi:iron complex transport system substrate-binding protein
MLRRILLVAIVLCWSGAGLAANIVDATGRTVPVPADIRRVLPAGPPAAVLLAAVAPDLMIGWPSPVSAQARALLSPQAARLPQVPRLTGREDVTDRVVALKPDLIVDYGTVSPRYSELARTTERRTGIPTILLDGSLDSIPNAFRTLGSVLHREARAEELARYAEALLSLSAGPRAPRRVLSARGADGLEVDAPGTDITEVFTHLGWHVVAPPGSGPFRQASMAEIGALDPDIVVFSDPAMSNTLSHSAPWQSLPAVREGHALVAPALPFGWTEEPPSINRLLGLAWLAGRDPATLAATFNAVVYGHVLTPAELQTVLAGVRTLPP